MSLAEDTRGGRLRLEYLRAEERLRRHGVRQTVLVGREYWRRAVDFEFLAARGMIDRRDARLLCIAEGAAEIWERVRRGLAS